MRRKWRVRVHFDDKIDGDSYLQGWKMDGHSYFGHYGCVRKTGICSSQFHEWKGYTKTEELNERGTKKEAPNQRVIKMKPLLNKIYMNLLPFILILERRH